MRAAVRRRRRSASSRRRRTTATGRHAPFYRRLYYSYKYFFAVSQPSRNERDGAIFAGTMGLIRRRALEQAGGWDEWCITEDAELSLRLLRDGWSGLHVDQSFGHGVMPLTFEALKGQRFRWCFGGIQILRRHWRSMLPGRQATDNRMTTGQRWAYLSGAVQWYGDLLALLFFLFLLVGAANIALGGGAAVPQADRVPARRDPAAGRARSGARGRAAAAGHRRVVARRARRLHDLAVDQPASSPARRCRRCSPEEGRVPAHTQDRMRGTVWCDAIRGQLGRVRAGAPWESPAIARSAHRHDRHRRAAARRAAGVADPELPGRAVQQPERATGGAAAATRGAKAQRVPALRRTPAHVCDRRTRACRRRHRAHGRAIRAGRACRHPAAADPRARPGPFSGLRSPVEYGHIIELRPELEHDVVRHVDDRHIDDHAKHDDNDRYVDLAIRPATSTGTTTTSTSTTTTTTTGTTSTGAPTATTATASP